jgi:hypothetical protein
VDLASEDPRWRARCLYLWRWLAVQKRSHVEVRLWGHETGFGWPEVEQQLSWLMLEKLAGGNAVHGWWAVPVPDEHAAKLDR